MNLERGRGRVRIGIRMEHELGTHSIREWRRVRLRLLLHPAAGLIRDFHHRVLATAAGHLSQPSPTVRRSNDEPLSNVSLNGSFHFHVRRTYGEVLEYRQKFEVELK